MSAPKRSAPGREIAGAAKLRLLAAYHASVATQLGSGTQRKGAASMSSIVEELLNLLGNDVVLLPIKRGNKGPSGKDMHGWENFTAARMQEPGFLARLNNGSNIGVKLGEQRATIDLDHDKDVETFLSRNPKLRETLRSRRKRGCNIWVRINGEYPRSCKLKTRSGQDWGEWRAEGNQTVIYGEAIDRKKGETQPTTYRIEHRAAPIELAFDEIRWPDELVLPWQNEPLATNNGQSLDELRRCYGQPYYSDENGIPRCLNESFWAGLFASENIILWEPSERVFYAYNVETGIYVEESVDAIKRRLSDRLLEASRQTNCSWLEKQRSDSRLNSIAAHLRGIVERRDAFVQRERRIHLANGIFRFENGGQLLRFSPAFLSRNRSPIVFDESATCPRFLNQLVYPAMHKDDVVLVQKYFGQILLGNNLIQRLLILDGLSERGKTQLANAIQAVVGHENCTQLRTNLLADRFETFRFIKKTLLVGVDVSPDFLSTKGASVLKGLVGGDRFDAEQKNGTGSFPFQGNFSVIVTSNARLRVRLCGDVGAWRRRLLIVRYEAPPPKKKIPDFGDQLVRDEGSGILNFAIAGLSMLLRDIDETGDIVLTERQRTIVESLLAESDSLRLFLQETVETADGADVSVNEIVEAYATFCPEKGWNPLPITEIHLSLKGLMLALFRVTKSHSVERDDKSVRGFFRVTLK
jgi:putative DNA primase/helicase